MTDRPRGIGGRSIQAIERTGTWVGVASGVVILVLMSLTCVDIFKRRITGRGIEGGLEITEVTLVATVFLGMMIAELTHSHVRTPILTDRLGNTTRLWVRTVGNLAAAVLLGVSILQSMKEAINSYQIGEVRHGVAMIPLWPARLVIPIGLCGLLLAIVLGIVNDFKQKG